MTKLSVVFFGSGPVAAKSLELLAQTFHIEAVVTKPRPQHHSGAVPVLDVTESLSIPTIEVSTKIDLTKKVLSSNFASRVAVLVDFGIIVEQSVIDKFPLGIVNSHFSLLPEWRGADPITFAILSGQATTGVSLMLLNDKMDEGDLLAQIPYDLPPKTTISELTSQLIELSDAALKSMLPLYVNGEIIPAPQALIAKTGLEAPTYSRKLTKQDGLIDWSKPAEILEREVRAYADWPKSYTKLGDIDIVITEADIIKSNDTIKPGTIRLDNNALMIKCSSDYLAINRLKPAGKRDMSTAEFLAGYRQKLPAKAY